jgi:hypothetical protein
MASNPRLLLLSGASLVGQNVLSTLARRRQGLRLAALNSEAQDPTLYDFDDAYLAPEARRDPAGFRARFLDVYDKTRPRLVIPCRDDDTLFLARMRESFPGQADSFLSGSVGAATTMLDKWRSSVFSAEQGLPFVPTALCADESGALAAFARTHGYPLVCKPREGFASREVSLLMNDSHLQRAAGRAEFVLQKYLGDSEQVRSFSRSAESSGLPLFHSFEAVKVSIQVLVGRTGACLGVFATFNTMRQGKSELVTVADDPGFLALGTRCATAFSHAGWRGPLNIQCQITPAGETWIYEYNGRFTGATSARYLLGFDEVGMALAEYAGLRLPQEDPPESARSVSRLPQSRAIEEKKVEALRLDGAWSKPPADGS